MGKETPITADIIKKLAPELTSDVSEDVISVFISEAEIQVEIDGLPEKRTSQNGRVIYIANQGVKYLTIHMLSVLAKDDGSGDVISTKVDQLEMHFSDFANTSWLQKTAWGRMYMDLLNRFRPYNPPIIIEN
ncbi:MAG: hypothetical protein [Bacteriophage sp.]|nr:MAG: hypothetical protein [Bacteriophage sp.]